MENTQLSNRLDAMVADGQGPVLVNFYNEACSSGVCGTQDTYLRKLSSDLQGASARIEQINLDDAPELVEKYQISTLPMALLFVDGEIHTRLSGLTDPGVLACALLQQVEEGDALMARSGHICPTPQAAA